jgi:hypothetical protein
LFILKKDFIPENMLVLVSLSSSLFFLKFTFFFRKCSFSFLSLSSPSSSEPESSSWYWFIYYRDTVLLTLSGLSLLSVPES